jgi:hypothetical protein
MKKRNIFIITGVTIAVIAVLFFGFGGHLSINSGIKGETQSQAGIVYEASSDITIDIQEDGDCQEDGGDGQEE